MTLFQLIRRFVRRHWVAYAASACMLTGITLLNAFIPRKIGAIIDAIVAGRLFGSELALRLAVPIAMGVVIYALRVGWRMQLFAAAYRFGMEMRTDLYARFS